MALPTAAVDGLTLGISKRYMFNATDLQSDSLESAIDSSPTRVRNVGYLNTAAGWQYVQFRRIDNLTHMYEFWLRVSPVHARI